MFPSVGEETARPPRGLFFLSVILVTLGSCGAATGLVQMQTAPHLPIGSAVDEEDEAERMAQLMVIDSVLRSPYRKPVAAGDALVSLLLLYAGFSLFRRRETALWWVTQAAFANALVVIVDAATQWYAIDSHWDDIVGPDPDVGLVAANAALFTVVLTGVVRLGIYIWVFWRVRRPDVRAALQAKLG
jgi:hypothetical protein